MSLGLWLTLLLSVAIETQTLDADTLAVAVDSCDRVLPEHCRAAPAAEPALFHVSLSADPGLTAVRIEVFRGDPGGPLSMSRTLVLDAAAPRSERARTLGLVIAAHVLAQGPPTPAPASAPAPQAARPAAARVRWTTDAALTVASALDVGAPRLGGMLRAGWLARRMPLGILVSLRGAARPGHELQLWWLSGTAGLFTRGTLGRFAAELRAELAVQRVVASAQEPGRREREHIDGVGARLGGELHFQLAGAYWLFAGVEASLLRPRLTVGLRGRDHGVEPPVGLGVLLGFRRAW